MLLLSPCGSCECVGVGRLGGRREGKGRGNVRASVHVVVVPMWLLRGRGRGEGTSEAQLRLERGPYEAQTERWYHFG
jgi:hypothetical protein